MDIFYHLLFWVPQRSHYTGAGFQASITDCMGTISISLVGSVSGRGQIMNVYNILDDKTSLRSSNLYSNINTVTAQYRGGRAANNKIMRVSPVKWIAFVCFDSLIPCQAAKN